MDEAIVDSNVLIRLLTDDPRELSIRAGAIIDLALDRNITLLVSSLTIAEIVYVLESVYKRDRNRIADELIDLVSSTDL